MHGHIRFIAWFAFITATSAWGQSSSPLFWRQVNLVDSIFRDVSFTVLCEGPGASVLAGNTSLWMRAPADSSWRRCSLDATSSGGFAALACSARGTILAAMVDGALLMSRDSGNTWTAPAAGWPTASAPYVYAFVWDDTTLYAATTIGLFRTRDDGRHWETLLGQSSHSTNPLNVFSVVRTDQGSIIAGSHLCFLRSTDDGHTWDTLIGQAETYEPISLGSRNGVVLSGMGSGGMLRSTDDGRTWDTLDAFDHEAPVSQILFCDDRTAIALEENTESLPAWLFRSHDAGVSWRADYTALVDSAGVYTLPSLLAPLANGRIGALCQGKVCTTSDTGNSWQRDASPPQERVARNLAPTAVSVGPAKRAVTAVAGHGVFLSTDEGSTWPDITANLPSTALSVVGIDPYGTIYVATDSGVFRRAASASAWTPTATGSLPRSVAAFAFDEIGDVFVATSTGVYRTTNNGEGWERASTGLNADSMLSIVSDSMGVLYAGSLEGVHRSTDRGDHWTAANADIEFEWVRAMCLAPNGGLYAGTYFNGVFHSADDGMSWRNVAGGSGGTCNALVADGRGGIFSGTDAGLWYLPPGTDTWIATGPASASLGRISALGRDARGMLFVADGNGLWIATSDPAAVDEAHVVPASTVVVCPNPVRDRITLCWDAQFTGKTTIVISDMLGRVVLVVTSNGSSATATLPTAALAPGAYRCTVQSGAVRRSVGFVRLHE